jgi:hypothetical protein
MFNEAPTDTVTIRPRRRWRFWLLLGGVPILALAVSCVVWLIRAQVGLQTAIDEADRLDPRWRLEEIEADRFTPPPGENAADKIAAIQRLRPPKWPGADMLPLFDDLPSERQLNSKQIAVIGERLALADEALAEARSLIDTPRGRFAASYSPMWFDVPIISLYNREAVTLLRFDVLDKAQAGDLDGAIRSCHAAFHAGCSIGDEPRMVQQITRLSIQVFAVSLLERVLAQGEPSDAALSALQARLEAEEPAPLLLYGLRGERAGEFFFLENIRNGTAPLGTVTAPGSPLSFNVENILYRSPGYLATQQASLLQYMNEDVEIAKLPPEQWAGPFAAQAAKVRHLPGLVKMLVAASDKVSQSCLRNHAVLRCAIVAIASERYRRSNGGWPATPDDLVKAGLLKSVPGDPFAAGQRIKYSRKADGLIVYSVGENGVDDSGNLTKDVNGIHADIGFRLWDVAARRQPPLPPKTP